MKYPDQTRNLSPTPEAAIAMNIWGKEYSEQRGGSMDFFDALPKGKKLRCESAWKEALKAAHNHGLDLAPTNQEGGE